jgi:hypothetical protein
MQLGSAGWSPSPLMRLAWHRSVLDSACYLVLSEAIGARLRHRLPGEVAIKERFGRWNSFLVTRQNEDARSLPIAILLEGIGFEPVHKLPFVLVELTDREKAINAIAHRV